MSTYPYSDSFALIRYILILIVIFGIIGSISQLVSGLFALANAQDVTTTTTTTTTKNIPSNNYHPQDRKSVEMSAVAMLIMALICFTFELIGLLGALLRKVSVVSVFAVVMAIAIVVNCFIGDGGLKLLIILLNLIMTTLSGVFVYMCIRQKEIEAYRQRNSMSISAIHDMSVSRDSVYH
ncbi:uncharacterized protein LOC124492622 [Dermatophagoides farinae]|uniref:Uncharacterized protein n=1 Tax=Dermatophagoides farinae TaxID=6954 RepID=A0A922LDP7_DERFA|nr:uncharacterized protein LOC124492622 [Dermatophagoides farinae]KAH7642667.1 hypothetical protein HUG17_5714 [Dermatophagoides farinae]KAH9530005.1 hypothetical protein DERF_003850 [Dermatophagoides farinae]